jgi:tetratricopeptide (TPR) repeat protein
MPTDEVSQSGLTRRSRICWLAGLVVVTISVGALAWSYCRPSVEELLRASRSAYDRGATEQAQRLVLRALARSPRSARALLAAGEIELALDRPEGALCYFARVDDDGSASAFAAAMAAGDILVGLRRLSEAEAYYRRIVNFDPENLAAHRKLARLLVLSGRREAVSHYLELVRHGQFDTHELALLGNPEDAFDNPDMASIFDSPLVRDRLLALGAAYFALHKHETSQAERQFREMATADPKDVDALAGWGAALVEVGSPGEFYSWQSQLPPAADAHPVIWANRGRWAEKAGEREVAIRCYLEAIQRDPNHWRTNYQVSLLLNARGDDKAAQAFQERSQRLKALLDVLYTLHLKTQSVDLMLEAARHCEALGRLWEAWGWNQAAASLRPDSSFARREALRIHKLLAIDTPQTLALSNPAGRVDLAQFPLPNWQKDARSQRRHPRTTTSHRARVAFADVAAQAGIDFTYYNGDDPDVAGMPMRASTGGGVAILDFDCDGWPDIHFTQGCDWPPESGQKRHLDRMFRNRGDGHFVDVTLSTGVGEAGYSQGVAVGDFNSDGFPDLYIANIGLNRLYQNNGDGTFADATAGLGVVESVWTTSCVLADLNGDALPDLYDVTYLAGREPLERVCYDERVKGAHRACVPGMFPAEQDRLLLNQGDGSFADVSAQAGIVVPDGKGLGIVAADFRNAGQIDLYIANDTKPNFFFVNAMPHSGAPPKFFESAFISGCALDSDGRAKASMGVAFDDVDGDGLFDLFITAFYHETNMLYLQQAGGLFADRTGEAGLKEPGLEMLGFGTQFLDADLDGWPDLVVTNGHVDDFTEAGIPYRMRAQFFWNRGQGQFEELFPAELGGFFDRQQLGRSLARLDFNRDGREDFVVSHLDTPAALVVNGTSGSGHYVTLKLHGVESNRDAVGTLVRFTIGERTVWKQLAAGDGYQASNQRQVVLGLGLHTAIDQLLVNWPSGREQRFMKVAADSEYILIEGRTELIGRGTP